MTSIRHKPAPTSQPGYCNLGTVLRVLCWANGLLLAWALARAADWTDPGSEVLPGAALVEPVCFSAVALLCTLRRPLARLQPWQRSGLVAALAAGLSLAALRLGRSAFGLGEETSALHAAILMAAGAALIQARLELRIRALSPALAEARLDALQSRIRPHFLFNSLNAVLALLREDPARAERVLEDLAELFRALLGDHRRLVPLATELEWCRRYLDIEHERLGERLQVEWSLPVPLPAAWLPPLVVQPLLENAVIHGIEPCPELGPAGAGSVPGPIRIVVEAGGGRLRVCVSNPAASPSLRPNGRQPGHGSALSNVRERLALHYDLEAGLEVTADAQLYSVTLQMPLGRPE